MTGTVRVAYSYGVDVSDNMRDGLYVVLAACHDGTIYMHEGPNGGGFYYHDLAAQLVSKVNASKVINLDYWSPAPPTPREMKDQINGAGKPPESDGWVASFVGG